MATPAALHEATIYARAGSHANDWIGGSWHRCIREYGLSPAHIELDVVTRNQLSAHRDELGEVVTIARAEMENLAAQIAGSGYALLLTDARGVILYDRIEQSLRADFRAAGLWEGANWSELRQGTNGIGTCIVEHRALTVHCADHFACRHTGLSCSAAPIRDPHGELLAVLDASSVQCEASRASQKHTVALVNMAARLIEKQTFLRANRDCRILRFHGRPEFVGLIHDGALAIDESGSVVAADDNAACQLGFDERRALVGHNIGDVFDTRTGLQIERGNGGVRGVWPLHELCRGRRYFASVLAPGRNARQRAARNEPAEAHTADNADDATGLRVHASPRSQALGFAEIRGDDPAMADNVHRAVRLADRRVPIVLRGETGTGKEVFAHAIHLASQRAAAPFIAVNCAAIPEQLIESELFGYQAGAFTGARRAGMRGKIAQSSGGTLFLDEIGDMPIELQTRLLRVLEQREVVPLGSETATPVDINILSATHADLAAEMAAGRFRRDLYYRLNGITLTLPAVRDRRDQRALLRSVLALEHREQQPVQVSADALAALAAFAWPGNIRQMRNVLRTALALCDDDTIRRADLPAEITGAPDAGDTGADRETTAGADSADSADRHARATNPLDSAERSALLGVLDSNCWHIAKSAAELGISRNTLYRKIKKQGIALRRR